MPDTPWATPWATSPEHSNDNIYDNTSPIFREKHKHEEHIITLVV